MVADTVNTLTTTMSSKGQVVIPKAVRERLGLRAGDVLEVEEQGNVLLLRVRHESPAAQRERLFGPPVPLESIVGMFADRVPPGMRGLSMAEMRRVAQADFAQRWRAKEDASKADDDDDDDDDDNIEGGDEP